MSWKDLLDSGSDRVLPWYGFRKVHDADRSWTLSGRDPPEHGWYRFSLKGGRGAELLDREPQPPDLTWGDRQPKHRGYLVGDRLIPDSASAALTKTDPDLTVLLKQTRRVYCLEPGLERFARIRSVDSRDGRLVGAEQEFPTGPEEAIIRAYQDRLENVDHVPNVTPALDLAFKWATLLRNQAEERRAALQRLREEEERRRVEVERVVQMMRDAGTAVGRRALAARDFEEAARGALGLSGATLLDVRPSYNRGEMVVQYRFEQRRFECVVDEKTLRVIDSGVCLTDEYSGVKGDTLFTLESLPGVIAEAIRLDKLVVFRRVDD